SFLSGLVACLLLVRPPGVLAQGLPAECDPDDPDLCSKPMVQGEVAPFNGQLVTPKLLISLGLNAESFDARLKLEIDRVEGTYKADLEYAETRYKNLQESTDKQIQLLTGELEKATNRVWYEHPGFIIACTLVAAVLIFVATAYLIEAVTESDQSVTYNYGAATPE
ncbi:MAG: hypothetical protein JSW58_14755, partial [Candidatus Latescibacterota bacterium]